MNKYKLPTFYSMRETWYQEYGRLTRQGIAPEQARKEANAIVCNIESLDNLIYENETPGHKKFWHGIFGRPKAGGPK